MLRIGFVNAMLIIASIANAAHGQDTVLWKTYMDKGNAAFSRSDFAAASTLFDAAVKECETAGRRNEWLIMSLYRLGQSEKELKEYSQAKVNLDKAWQLAREQNLTDKYGFIAKNLGEIAEAQNDFPEAEKQLRIGLSAAEKMSTAVPGNYMASCLEHLSRVLKSEGKDVEADAVAEKAAELKKSSGDKSPQQLVDDGIMALQSKEYDKAIETFQKVLVQVPGWRPAQANLAVAYQNKALSLQSEKKYLDAELNYKKSVSLMESVTGQPVPLVRAYTGLVETYESEGKLKEAEEACSKMTFLARRERSLDLLSGALIIEARLLKKLGRSSDAEAVNREIAQVVQAKAASESPAMTEYRARLVSSIRKKWIGQGAKVAGHQNLFVQLQIKKDGSISFLHVTCLYSAEKDLQQSFEKFLASMSPFEAPPSTLKVPLSLDFVIPL